MDTQKIRTTVRAVTLKPLVIALAACGAGSSMCAQAQLEEVIVTAQKRSQSINEVPMSITALSGEDMANRGIELAQDLNKTVPGFNYSESRVGTPIYTLRGVGFNDIALGGRPTVSVYQDEVPIPFAIETRGSFLDLERTEILVGPQGTLFGQNSTGGAINLIAAKPTDEFEGGVDVRLGNFGAVTGGGYVSGPLSDELRFRVAANKRTRDAWQDNYTGPGEMGEVDLTTYRLLLDWTPSDTLTIGLNLNGYQDSSESQAPQLVGIAPGIPPLAPFVPGLLDAQLAPEENEAADWTPADYERDNSFFQANLRVDWDLNEDFTLTSLTSYSEYEAEQTQDVDGMALVGYQQTTFGDIESFFQELRIAGPIGDNMFLTAGVNYMYDETREFNKGDLRDSTLSLAFGGLSTFDLQNDQDIETYAVFANLEVDITDSLTAHGGLRYTDTRNEFTGCTRDSGDGSAAAIFGFFLGTEILPGGCFTSDATATPQLVENELDESNVSWRFGLDWNFSEESKLYANVSRGFKAGGFPTLAATATVQYDPTVEEELTAYELGFKGTLSDSVQLNGAVFYYDYTDKQVLGFFDDPIFGPILRLINVPDSEVTGAEVQFIWATPVEGLDISAAASHIESEVTDDFFNPDAFGVVKNFKGESFPNAPDTQIALDISYRWAAFNDTEMFVGANASYQSDTNAEFGESPELAIDSYSLIDLRAGIESNSGSWRVMAWARNVADDYYWTNASKTNDTIIRFTGQPRTFGVDFRYNFGG